MKQSSEIISSDLQAIRSTRYSVSLHPINASNAHLAGFSNDEKPYDVIPMYYFAICLIKAAPIDALTGNIGMNHPKAHNKFEVLDESCTALFKNERNRSLVMMQLGDDTYRQYQNQLSSYFLAEKEMKFNDKHGLAYVAAFGAGASLNLFSKPVAQAFKTMVPVPKRQGLVVLGLQMAVSFTPTQDDSFGVFSSHLSASASDMQYKTEQRLLNTYKEVLAKGSVQQPAGEEGEAEGHVMLKPYDEELMKEELSKAGKEQGWDQVARSAATHSLAFGAGILAARVFAGVGSLAGPKGTVLGQMAIPFMTTVVLMSNPNPAKELSESFNHLLAVHQKPGDVNRGNTWDLGHDSLLFKVIPLMAQSLVAGHWATPQQIHQYCIPKRGTAPTCSAISHEVAEASQAQPDNTAAE